MEMEVGAATGAAYGEKNPLRTVQRNLTLRHSCPRLDVKRVA
jgi:hypothetical protein